MSQAQGAEGYLKYCETQRTLRETNRVIAVAEATSEIRTLTDREVLIAGAVAYWCEGGKRKPG